MFIWEERHRTKRITPWNENYGDIYVLIRNIQSI
jgi:hypothetical protein